MFNKNKIQESYSCMQNIKSIINNHDIKDLNNSAESCNCRNKNNCPLDGKCLTRNIIYEAQITSNQLKYKQKFHMGTTKTDFEHRFNNHAKSFNCEHYENDTGRSKGDLTRNDLYDAICVTLIRFLYDSTNLNVYIAES